VFASAIRSMWAPVSSFGRFSRDGFLPDGFPDFAD